MPGPLIEHEAERFRRAPLSVRTAGFLIVLATTLTMILGALLVWLFDRHDFPNFGVALWWSLQTVTTVGYGDVVPHNVVGRVIGSVVIVESVAFLAIITATITSAFVDQARQRREAERGTVTNRDLDDRLRSLMTQVEQLEASVRRLSENGPEPRNDRDG